MTTSKTPTKGWSGLVTKQAHIHLSHFLLPLGLSHLTVDELLNRIDQTYTLGSQAPHLINSDGHLTLGLNAPGNHELLVHPNKDCVTLVPTFYVQSFEHFTPAYAQQILPLIGDNSCGPDSAQELMADLQQACCDAALLDHPIALSYASLFDLLIFPQGRWLVYSNVLYSSVTLLRNHDLD